MKIRNKIKNIMMVCLFSVATQTHGSYSSVQDTVNSVKESIADKLDSIGWYQLSDLVKGTISPAENASQYAPPQVSDYVYGAPQGYQAPYAQAPFPPSQQWAAPQPAGHYPQQGVPIYPPQNYAVPQAQIAPQQPVYSYIGPEQYLGQVAMTPGEYFDNQNPNTTYTVQKAVNAPWLIGRDLNALERSDWPKRFGLVSGALMATQQPATPAELQQVASFPTTNMSRSGSQQQLAYPLPNYTPLPSATTLLQIPPSYSITTNGSLPPMTGEVSKNSSQRSIRSSQSLSNVPPLFDAPTAPLVRQFSGPTLPIPSNSNLKDRDPVRPYLMVFTPPTSPQSNPQAGSPSSNVSVTDR